MRQAFCLYLAPWDAATHLKTSDSTYHLLSELLHFCSKNRHFVCAVAARAKLSVHYWKSSPFTVLVFHRILAVATWSMWKRVVSCIGRRRLQQGKEEVDLGLYVLTVTLKTLRCFRRTGLQAVDHSPECPGCSLGRNSWKGNW